MSDFRPLWGGPADLFRFSICVFLNFKNTASVHIALQSKFMCLQESDMLPTCLTPPRTYLAQTMP